MPSKGENRLKTIFASRWFLAVAMVLLLLLVMAYARAYYQNYQIDQEIQRLQDETKKLEARKMETLDLLKYVKSSDYVEKQARTELNLVKDGEQVAVISGSRAGATGQSTDKVVESTKMVNLIKWWRYFFGTNSTN